MPHAHVVTRTIPGPKSKALLGEKEQYVSSAIGIHLPAVIERAEGALLHDIDGNTFLDLSGGVGVMKRRESPLIHEIEGNTFIAPSGGVG